MTNVIPIHSVYVWSRFIYLLTRNNSHTVLQCFINVVMNFKTMKKIYISKLVYVYIFSNQFENLK